MIEAPKPLRTFPRPYLLSPHRVVRLPVLGFINNSDAACATRLGDPSLVSHLIGGRPTRDRRNLEALSLNERVDGEAARIFR